MTPEKVCQEKRAGNVPNVDQRKGNGNAEKNVTVTPTANATGSTSTPIRAPSTPGTIKKPIFPKPTDEDSSTSTESSHSEPGSNASASSAQQTGEENAVARAPATPIYNAKLHVHNVPKAGFSFIPAWTNLMFCQSPFE